jgi:hypothetical protein
VLLAAYAAMYQRVHLRRLTRVLASGQADHPEMDEARLPDPEREYLESIRGDSRNHTAHVAFESSQARQTKNMLL